MPRMSEDGSKDARETARKAREERLAAALRANLRRRKAAVRDLAGPGPQGPAEPAPERRPGEGEGRE